MPNDDIKKRTVELLFCIAVNDDWSGGREKRSVEEREKIWRLNDHVSGCYLLGG